MSQLETILPQVQAAPLHRQLGVKEIRAGNGEAILEVPVSDGNINPAGVLHGGVVYTLCDVVAYCALLSELQDGEDAVTHDIHVNVMRAAKAGERVRFTGRVVRRGRSLAFVEAAAHSGENLLARAQITKSIIQARS